jgi:hypothetical protein
MVPELGQVLAPGDEKLAVGFITAGRNVHTRCVSERIQTRDDDNLSFSEKINEERMLDGLIQDFD